MPRREASAIPVGTQFSPDLIDLPGFLHAIVRYSGDRAAMKSEIWKPSVRVKRPRGAVSRRVESLPLEAAVHYGLLSKRIERLETIYDATDLARSLEQMPEAEFYATFARHILLERGGLRVVEAVREMTREGWQVTGPERPGARREASLETCRQSGASRLGLLGKGSEGEAR